MGQLCLDIFLLQCTCSMQKNLGSQIWVCLCLLSSNLNQDQRATPAATAHAPGPQNAEPSRVPKGQGPSRKRITQSKPLEYDVSCYLVSGMQMHGHGRVFGRVRPSSYSALGFVTGRVRPSSYSDLGFVTGRVRPSSYRALSQ